MPLLDPSSFTAFTVKQQSPLSDHNQTNIKTQTNDTLKQNPLKTCKINHIQLTCRRASDSTDKFIQAPYSKELKNRITTFIKRDNSHKKSVII